MAKYLTDELELQSVANAIRAKNKSQGSLAFPTDFVSAIANILSGGNIEEDGNGNLTFSTDGDTVGKIPLTVSANGTYTPPAGKAYSVVEVNLGSPAAKDVNFRDYDGTITNSYSKEEFSTLTAMPANPSHDGLTAQGWNWDLANAKAHVAKYGRLDVGQMYITDDGKTRVYIHLEKGRTSPMLGVCLNGTVDVDWGDGTTHDTLTGTDITIVQWTPNHNYAAPGDYVIKLTVDGSMGFYGSSSNNQYSGLLRYASNADSRNLNYQDAIQRVEIGSGVISIEDNAFLRCHSLSNISIPDSVTVFGSAAFNYCYSLSNINIPDGITSIGNYTFSYCYSLSSISIPNDITSIGSYAFASCYNLSSISIPDGVTSFLASAFYSCNSLSNINIPDSVTSLGSSIFASCSSLSSINIPDGVTSLEGSMFNGCYCLSNISIPDSVTSLGPSVFASCYGLSNISIPDNVTSIYGSAFQLCYGIAEYHFASTTPPVLSKNNIFNGIPADCIIYVPYSSDHSILEAYKTATNWSTYASYMQEEPV